MFLQLSVMVSGAVILILLKNGLKKGKLYYQLPSYSFT